MAVDGSFLGPDTVRMVRDVANLMSGRTMGMSYSFREEDGHPDPLVVSPDYPDPLPGWFTLSAHTCTEGRYVRAGEPLSMLVFTPIAEGTEVPAMTTVWHHPDEYYAREIARQIITRDRRVFTHVPGTTDTWAYGTPAVVQLNRVIEDHRGDRLEPVAYCVCCYSYPMCTVDDLMNPPDSYVQREAVWHEGSCAHAWGYSM